jgi:hypothetical protein
MLMAYSFAIDISVGALRNNLSNSFSVRFVAMLALSCSTAFFIQKFFIGGDIKKIRGIVFTAFIVQAVFWVVSFVDPNIKILLYKIMGQGNSVNLRSHNINARGFGLSTEINYTTPFVMVLLCFTLLKSKIMLIATTLLQLANSNLVIFAGILGIIFSKSQKLSFKLVMISSFIFAVVWSGPILLPRFFAEFFGDSSSRTVLILLENHFVLIYQNFTELMFGTGEYTFQEGHSVSSDIGWVIMLNYGGVFFVIMYLILVSLAILLSFTSNSTRVLWFISALILNTKGLLLGPNAFFFSLSLFVFFVHSRKLSKK